MTIRRGTAAAALAAALAAGCGAARAEGTTGVSLPAPVSEPDLARLRGGDLAADPATGMSTSVVLAGDVAGNRLRAAATGMNAIGQDAFAGMQGLGTVIQNSGNQVLIQNSVILNVDMRQ